MIDPGLLKTRLTLPAPHETDDGQGDVVRSYSPQQTLWAWVAPLVTRERDEADAEGANQRVRIVIRAGVALSLQHRLADLARCAAEAAVAAAVEGLQFADELIEPARRRCEFTQAEPQREAGGRRPQQ
jgi:head-tail adaptor